MADIVGNGINKTLNGTNASDNITGSAIAETINAGKNADKVLGGGGDDKINGEDGDDTLNGGIGNDKIDGGKHNDTAEFTGSADNYTFRWINGGTLEVSGTDGIDTITGVETLQFGNQKYSINGPIARSDAGAGTENQTITVANVLANDVTLATSATLSIQKLGGGNAVIGDTIATVDGISVKLGANNSLVFDPGTTYDYLSASEVLTRTFSYTIGNGTLNVVDNSPNFSSATVTLTITGSNDGPVAVSDSKVTAEDAVLTVAASDLLNGDSDIDHLDVLTVTGVGNGSNGAVDLVDGQITFTPDTNYNGPASFEYTISDGQGGTATATVHVTVNSVNDAPVLADDVLTTDEDTPATTINVLDNDSDVDSSLTPANMIDYTQGSNGSVTAISGGRFIYTPNANFYGSDSFTYTVNDHAGGTATATVHVTVNSVNDAPVAENQAYDVNEDETVTGYSVANHTYDEEQNPLIYTVVDGPTHGSLTLNPDGSFAYTPNANYDGVDSFTYKAHDGSTDSNVATVTLSMLPRNDAPTLAVPGAQSTTTPVGLAIQGVVVSDQDAGDTFTVNLATGSAGAYLTVLGKSFGGQFGNVVGSGSPNVTITGSLAEVNASLATIGYGPYEATPGPDGISITVTDAAGALTSAVIPVTILDTSPTITSDGSGNTAAILVAENTTAVTTVTATDADAGDTLTYSISGGFDQSFFAIDEQTGLLTWKQAPDYENPLDPPYPGSPTAQDQLYDVQVRVTDSSGSFDDQLITVTVTDVDDVAPPSLSSSEVPSTAHGVVTTADVNGDGKADIIITNGGSSSTSVFLGLGDGTFGPESSFASGVNSTYVAAADLNGDHNQDLVVSNYGFGVNTISVLQGNGDGTFLAPVAYAGGETPWEIRLVDVNHDTKLDAVVSNNSNSNGFSVIIGNGDGSFQSPVNYSGFVNATGLVVDDFNEDGNSDVAVNGYNFGDLHIYTGAADGTMTSTLVIETGLSGLLDLESADFNGDGHQDLVYSDLAGDVFVGFGNGDGTFQEAAQYSIGQRSFDVSVADLNGDGRPDLLVSNGDPWFTATKTGISVLLNDGDGTFGPPTVYETGAPSAFISTADFNGDDSPDVVSANTTTSLSILLNDFI